MISIKDPIWGELSNSYRNFYLYTPRFLLNENGDIFIFIFIDNQSNFNDSNTY